MPKRKVQPAQGGPEAEKPRTPSTRDALLAEALKIIEQDGIEKLSLRAVARRLGISHQAPYKHFDSRDHILAELVSRLHDEFTDHLEDRPDTEQPFVDLGNIGVRFFDYAFAHPLKYELLFARIFPADAGDALQLATARKAFELLETRLETMEIRPTRQGPKSARLDAFFIWATLHGIVSILNSNAVETIGIEESDRDALLQHMFDRIGAALDPTQ